MPTDGMETPVGDGGLPRSHEPRYCLYVGMLTSGNISRATRPAPVPNALAGFLRRHDNGRAKLLCIVAPGISGASNTQPSPLVPQDCAGLFLRSAVAGCLPKHICP